MCRAFLLRSPGSHPAVFFPSFAACPFFLSGTRDTGFGTTFTGASDITPRVDVFDDPTGAGSGWFGETN